MKRINSTLLATLMMSGILSAGGIFTEPVYETEDIVLADENVVEEVYMPVEEEIVEEYIEEDIPEVIETPIMVEEVIVPPLVQDVKANGLYAGIGISATKFKTACKNSGTGTGCRKSGTDKTVGLMARVGYDINQYVGIEARGIRTNWKANGGKVKHVGIFLKPMLPVGDATNLYALAGVAKTTTQGKLQRVNAKSFAWGAGVEYDVSKDVAKEGRYSRAFDGKGDQEKGLGVFADYERLVQKSGSPDLDTVNVGVTYDF